MERNFDVFDESAFKLAGIVSFFVLGGVLELLLMRLELPLVLTALVAVAILLELFIHEWKASYMGLIFHMIFFLSYFFLIGIFNIEEKAETEGMFSLLQWFLPMALFGVRSILHFFVLEKDYEEAEFFVCLLM